MLTPQQDSQFKEAQAIRELAETPGWVEYLEPWLKAKRDQSFPDPSQFKSEEEFGYAAKTASVFKKVIAEILIYIESQKDAFEKLNTKQKQDHDPFAVGK